MRCLIGKRERKGEKKKWKQQERGGARYLISLLATFLLSLRRTAGFFRFDLPILPDIYNRDPFGLELDSTLIFFLMDLREWNDRQVDLNLLPLTKYSHMILSRILLQNITRRSSLLLPLSSTATSAATLSHFSRSYAARSSSKTPPPTDNPSLPGDIYIGEVPLPPPSPTPIPSPSPPSEPASAVTPLSSSAPPASPPTQKNLAEEFMSDALDLQPSPPSSSFGATTGARSRTQTSSTSDRKRRNLSRMAVLFGLATVVGSTAWLGREWEEGEGDKLIARSEDEDGKEWVKKDEWYWKWAGRARLRGADLFDVSILSRFSLCQMLIFFNFSI